MVVGELLYAKTAAEAVALEVLPVVENLAGHGGSRSSSPTPSTPIHKQFGDIQGPWIMEFNVAEMP